MVLIKLVIMFCRRNIVIVLTCLFQVFIDSKDPVSIQKHKRRGYSVYSSFWSNPDDNIHYFLYTRNNPDKYQELKINDTELLMLSNFDFKQKTKIIVHGWLSAGTASAPEEIKSDSETTNKHTVIKSFPAYLQVTDDNVINVDWSYNAKTLYTLARFYVSTVSQSLTDFLIFLVDNGVKTSDIHLIGHSLGAHVVGVAGHYYNKQLKPIRIISALDPAKPLFQWSNDENRLDKSDAVHVEVIHTCGGFLGFASPLGDLDFYPNGGRKQPGCGWDFTGSCAHNRAILYFAESITSPVAFTSVQCKNYDDVYYNGQCETNNAKMLNMSGLHLNIGNKGVYYLKTNAEPPFALGNPDNWKDSSLINSV